MYGNISSPSVASATPAFIMQNRSCQMDVIRPSFRAMPSFVGYSSPVPTLKGEGIVVVPGGGESTTEQPGVSITSDQSL
eukprot:CAMPEP_0185789842 /NCGR_PEP_ID=MMETSP1174-20130828/153110_1 /TAXON_ID=35687 /ORGANISM="Dictyocha speculum, Strain CCMP1381" /LENGTH=78 /DNA_ID=CAMNT_0028484185 /DNA_START=89 /DNA_END=322 /DNA_ORIENTATION=+